MLSWSNFNLSGILKIIGALVVIEGLFMLLAVPFSYYYQDGILDSLLISSLITLTSGGILYFSMRKSRSKNLGKREGYIIVSFSWLIISLFGTLPYLISGTIPTFTNAFFETMSGFTTTGSTIFNDIESMPKGLLFWRSTTHWIGGMGIIVLSLAILPILGGSGMSQLFGAEAPGPTTDKIHPRMAGTAKRLWIIYVLLTLTETILLVFVGGMKFFDAICHSFATMATGGFSTKNDSIAGFSPSVHWIIIVFMFLAGVNFTLHYFGLHWKWKKIFKNQEFKFYVGMLFVAGGIISLGLFLNNGQDFVDATRDALFQVVSISTTTGFVSSDYLLWPTYLWVLIFILMFTGGSAGSTGGGIKQIRILILIKTIAVEFKYLIHPKAVIPVKYNGKNVSDDITHKILGFFLLYMMIFVFSTFVMSLFGLDFKTSIGTVIASLGNIGPGIGGVGPVENYASIPTLGKWFLSFLMLIGRLELFTVLILFYPPFWRKN